MATMYVQTSEKPRKSARGDRGQVGIQPAKIAGAKHLFLRQDVVKCSTGLGRGDCVEAGTCRGFFETDRNLCPQGDGPRECCLLRRCNVSEGSGFCQSTIGKRCERDGKYFEGTGPPWPCIGPDDVQCCVKNEDINKSSSTSASTSTTSSSTSSSHLTTSSLPPTTTNSPASTTANPTSSKPPSTDSTGLSAGAKGGIAGGVVAGVLIMGLIAALFFVLGRQRNSKKGASAADEARPPTPTAAEKRQEENTMTEKADDSYSKPELLGGSPLSELPAGSHARELDSPAVGGEIKSDVADRTAPTVQKRPKGPVELPAYALGQ